MIIIIIYGLAEKERHFLLALHNFKNDLCFICFCKIFEAFVQTAKMLILL